MSTMVSDEMARKFAMRHVRASYALERGDKMETPLTTRQIVEQLLANSLADHESPEYIRALRNVLQLDEAERQAELTQTMIAVVEGDKRPVTPTRSPDGRMEVLTTREILERMLVNATVNRDDQSYRRALHDALQYDDQHRIRSEPVTALERLAAFAQRILDLSDEERRRISLGQIEDWAREALGQS